MDDVHPRPRLLVKAHIISDQFTPVAFFLYTAHRPTLRFVFLFCRLLRLPSLLLISHGPPLALCRIFPYALSVDLLHTKPISAPFTSISNTRRKELPRTLQSRLTSTLGNGILYLSNTSARILCIALDQKFEDLFYFD